LKNIVLIGVPTRNDLKLVNTGLFYIIAVLKKAGYNVTVIDAVARDYTVPEIVELTREAQPDLIGMSGIVTTYYFLEPLTNDLKKNFPEIPLIIGGSVGGSIPNLLEENTDVDIIVEGEGEQAIIELLDALQSDSSDLSGVPGIYYREDGKLKYTGPRRMGTASVGSLDVLPYPAYDDIDMEFYIEINSRVHSSISDQLPEYRGRSWRMFPLIPTRGCPYTCSFCHRLIKKYRTHSVDYLIEQIKFLVREYKINGFTLFDELIMVNKPWLMEFCDRLVEEDLDVVFFSGGGKPNMFTRDLLVKMKAAKFIKLGYGVESGSQKILDLMDKKVSVEQNLAAITTTNELGMVSQSNFVFGHYGENRETIRETAQFIARTGKTKDAYQIFFLALYPGTPNYDQAIREGLITNEREHLLNVTGQADYLVNASEFRTREELIYNVWKYLNLYDALTFAKRGNVMMALNRLGRVALSSLVYHSTERKWPRAEEFVKGYLRRWNIHEDLPPDFFSEDINPYARGLNKKAATASGPSAI